MKKLAIFILVFIVFLVLVGVLALRVFQKPVKKGGEQENLKLKMEKVLMVLAPENFRDEEYLKPRSILEEAGAEIIVASKGTSQAKGLLGARAKVDKDITQVNVDDYKALVFVGGPGASVYFNDQDVLDLAKSAYEKRIIVGAICIAPSILANSGILFGKNATSFPSEEANLKVKGANYTGETVTVDGKIITGHGPEAAEEFGKKIVEVLGL